MVRYLTSADIHGQREEAIEQSRESFQPMYDKFNAAIDALLIIQYSFCFSEQTPSTPLQRVHSQVAKWLYSSIFGFHASLSLAEQGFYHQSVDINRNLMENLVSAHYLADMPADIDRIPRVSTKVNNPLTKRECFEHVVPGYYKSGYKFSSEFTHPGRASHIFKVPPDGAGGNKVDMETSFNPEWMGLCLNELTMLLAGFLKIYSVKYKDVLKYKNTSDTVRIKNASAGLREVLEGHIALKGVEKPWLRTTRPLWDWLGCDEIGR